MSAIGFLGRGMQFVIDGLVAAKIGDSVIGTKITHQGQLQALILDAMADHDPSQDQAPGQHFIMLPNAKDCVSIGVAKHTGNADDYIVRIHRGQPDFFLKRSVANAPDGVAAIVYTREAYLADPDVKAMETHILTWDNDSTHVLVDVLAFSGPNPPVSPWRFVCNLAGGNNAYKTKTADELRTEAEEIKTYHSEWCVVAD